MQSKFKYGTVHFLRGTGAGGIWGGGGHVKRNDLKGGPSKKIRGGHVKYFCNT